jgi:hypothetical protein
LDEVLPGRRSRKSRFSCGNARLACRAGQGSASCRCATPLGCANRGHPFHHARFVPMNT